MSKLTPAFRLALSNRLEKDVPGLIEKSEARKEFRRQAYRNFYSKASCTPEEWISLKEKRLAALPKCT